MYAFYAMHIYHNIIIISYLCYTSENNNLFSLGFSLDDLLLVASNFYTERLQIFCLARITA